MPPSLITQLLELVRDLRHPKNGCDWDKKQDFRSIAPYTLEEAYEVVEAVELNQPDFLKEELGDLLFQIIFYTVLAEEKTLFTFEDIVENILRKMIARHPHVFAVNKDSFSNQSETIEKSWEIRKNVQKSSTPNGSILDLIPFHVPALLRAEKLQKKAASVGFDWGSAGDIFHKIDEEVQELKDAIKNQDLGNIEEEMGDILFTCINLSRHLKIDAETALRKANRKFETRFRKMENLAAAQQTRLGDVTQEKLELFWQEAKKNNPQ